MKRARFPRRRHADAASAAGAAFQGVGRGQPFFKRDDLLGFAAGGNKVRKLEFVMADALEKEVDFIITCGAGQFNHSALNVQLTTA